MVKGLLIRARGPLGIIMTSEGRFVRIILGAKSRCLGQEVQGRELKVPSLAQTMAVASVILVLLVGLWANSSLKPAAAAYVALDINPSIELSVNASGQVIRAQGLDPEGVLLLKKVHPEQLEIYKAVAVLVEGAVQYQYLNDVNDVVLVTITPAEGQQPVAIKQEKIEASVNQAVTALPTPVKVITGVATPEEHREAGQKGISVGRYLIYREILQQGGDLSLEEVKTKGLGQLEKEKNIQLQKSSNNGEKETLSVLKSEEKEIHSKEYIGVKDVQSAQEHQKIDDEPSKNQALPAIKVQDQAKNLNEDRDKDKDKDRDKKKDKNKDEEKEKRCSSKVRDEKKKDRDHSSRNPSRAMDNNRWRDGPYPYPIKAEDKANSRQHSWREKNETNKQWKCRGLKDR